MFELPGVVAFDLLGSGAFEVIRAEVLVWLALCEHVARDDQDRMSDGDESPLLASVDHDAPEQGCEICAFGTRGDPGDLRDEASQPRAPVPGSTGEAFACALMVAGTKPGPARQMPCRGKLRHVGSDLGDDCTCGYAVDARDDV